MEKPHMSRHARILILASILSACTDKAALQARDAEIVALKGQLAAMEARTAAAEKRITAVREGHRPTFDPIQDAPTPVQDGLRYLEAMERFTIADWQTANLPSSRRLTSEKLGCGSVLCPSDYDLLHLAEKAAAPTPAQVVAAFTEGRPVGQPVLLEGTLAAVQPAAAITSALLKVGDDAFFIYGRHFFDFTAGQRVEVIGVLGFLQKVQLDDGPRNVPTIAYEAVLQPGSITKIRALAK